VLRRLVEAVVAYPVSVAVGVILLVLFGGLSLARIPIQLVPTVDRPEITVETVWRGASPEEVEREIVDRQEEHLKATDGLVEMTSESLDGLGRVILKFQVGTDLDAARLRVANRLNQVPRYPPDVEQPVILTVNRGDQAVAWYVLRPRPGNPVDITAQRDFAENVIKPRLERVTGVAASNVFGGRRRQMRLTLDPDAMAARGVTLTDLREALAGENANTSGGDFDEGKRRYLVRTLGEFRSPREIRQVIVAHRNGAPVYVRDVATVDLGYENPEFAVRQKGHPTIAINAQRQVGSNVLQVMAGLRVAVGEMNRGILADHGLALEQVYDETTYVHSSIALVRNNLLVGGLLAGAVLLVFLRSGSSTFVIALAIPISAIGTFLVMALLGRTLNVVSLAGMTFAVGMLVDNAIVILENIYRHRELGRSRRMAAIEGTAEVYGAVLASTLTTMAVFVPVFFVREETGQLFRDIAVAISAGVGLSLLVSVTVVPCLSARILGVAGAEGPGGAAAAAGARNLWGLVPLASRATDRLADFIAWVTPRTGWRLGIAAGLTGLSLGLSALLMPDAEYLPEGNRNLLFGILLPPPGYNLDELTDIGKRIEEPLRPRWEASPGSPEARAVEGPLLENFFYVARGRLVFMGAIAADPERARELMPYVRAPLGTIPGMIAVVQQASLFERGLAQGRSVDIRITGPDLERLTALGGEIFGRALAALPGAQLRPIPSLDLANPQIQVVLDRDRAAALGLTSRDLGFMLDSLVDGAKVGEYWHEGDRIDLMVRGADPFARHTQDIGQMNIRTAAGRVVPVESVAEVRVTTGPEQIDRFERERSITIRAIPPSEMPLETAMRRIDTDVLGPLRQRDAFGGAEHVRLAGTADDLSTTYLALRGTFLLALVITYLLMASLFESFLYPFVIMFSVPLSAFGGFLGLWLVNRLVAPQALDVITMLGFVILVGVVVNNAILIVHQTLNYMTVDQLAFPEALRESVRSRVRPIFMTTLTTFLGTLPLAVSTGAGSELYRGIGSVFLGGLLVSTVFTLVLVPVVFSLTLDAKTRLGGLLARIRPAAPAHAGGGEEA
jgi:hydrophobic/amphiphilic exporter-1 (mainly G- bacteria), HAE1 family